MNGKSNSKTCRKARVLVGHLNFRPVAVGWPLLALLLLLAYVGRAQIIQPMQSRRGHTDTAQGYWRLKTLAVNRSTLVQFYGPGHQLLYEEMLPGKWVNLTKRNQKQFDQLLVQLVGNQLLASRIKTEVLSSPQDELSPLQVTYQTVPISQYVPEAASYLVHAYISQAGKLYLIVNNPERLRYKVSVIDQRNWPVFEEFTNHNRFRRKFDLSAINSSSYQVIVQIDNKPFVYQVKRRPDTLAYTIQSEVAVSRQAVVLPRPPEEKSLSIPVTIDL